MSAQQPYGYSMATQYESGLETAPHNYPEVAYDQQPGYHPGLHPGQHLPYSEPPKPEQSPSTTYVAASPYSAAGSQHPPPHSQAQQYQQSPSKKGTTVCGCSLLVFILACIIALLSAAVIGLAAGTGIEANRANDATNQLAVLSSAVAAATSTPAAAAGATGTGTTSGATPSPTAVAGAIDDGCAENPGNVTGSTYTSFSLLGGLKFKRYCGRDTKFNPLMSLFVANFQTCMDACAGYTFYVPEYFGNGANATCGAVSFIPLWTNKVQALQGGAPGNCYLKPAGQPDQLPVANIGTPCHAAVYQPGAS